MQYTDQLCIFFKETFVIFKPIVMRAFPFVLDKVVGRTKKNIPRNKKDTLFNTTYAINVRS